MENDYIKFLGTAGARFVMAKQLRGSGGVFINLNDQKILLDPGPGSLVRCASSRPAIDPSQLDAVILTHAHIDHSNDVNVIIDAMTQGGLKKRGTLFAPRDCLEGDNAVVLKYLRGFLKEIVVLEAQSSYTLGDLTFSTSIKHTHQTETFGIKFDPQGKSIFFLTDTAFFSELAQEYTKPNILVVNVVRYKYDGNRKILHLSVDEVKQLIRELRPKQTILTHFGMTMIKAKPWEVAANLTEELGLSVIAAADGMRVDV